MKWMKTSLLLLVSVALGLSLGVWLNRVEPGAVVDCCFDARGAYCVLAERDGETRLLRFSPSGVLLGAAALERTDGGARADYTALAADGLGNLYVLCRRSQELGGAAGRLVLSETVRMYDAALTRRRDALTLDHGGGLDQPVIRRVAALGETVYAVCLRGGRLEVQAARAAAGDAPYRVASCPLPAGAEPSELAVDASGRVLWTTAHGGLYLAERRAVRDLSGSLGGPAVPAELGVDDGGRLRFSERLSGVSYRVKEGRLEEAEPPEWTPPETLRGPLFPDLALRAALCGLAVGALLGAAWALARRGWRGRRLLPALLRHLGALCAAAALLLTLALTAMDLAPARDRVEEKLTGLAEDLAANLAEQGLGRTDLLAARGTETAAGLAAALDRAAGAWTEQTGWACTATLYDSRRQRWFRALDGVGTGDFVPASDGALDAVLAGGPAFWTDRAGDAVRVLVAVPTADGAAVLEIRAGWGPTLGAALGRSLLGRGACALSFALLLWLGGRRLLRRSLGPLDPLARDVLALAGGAAPETAGNELEALAECAHRAALRQGERADPAGEELPAGRALRALMDGGDPTRVMGTLYAVYEGPDSFPALQARLDRLCAAVRKNGGCVAVCGGDRLLALFPGGAWDGIRAAVEFRESFRAEGAAEPHLVVDRGEVTLGTAAGTVQAFSAGIARSARLAGALPEWGVTGLLTAGALSSLGEGQVPCVRLVGFGADGRRYELLDGLPYHTKKLLLATRADFERGVEAQERGDEAQARRCFAAVVGVDRGDRAALFHLSACGKAGDEGWNGTG